MNFVGVDVRGIDIHRFQEALRAVYLLVYLLWVASLWMRKRRSSLWGPIALSLVCWFMTTFPLQGLYALAFNTDRMRHLWWSATVAAGHPAWESGILDRSSLEPAWSLFVSVLALRDPERVFTVFAYLPALVIALTGIGLIVSLREMAPSGTTASSSPEEDQGWHAALWVGFFVLLASTGPIDYLNPYRAFWAKSFLLKPNHALGFALVPLCVALSSKELNGRRSAMVVALLGLLGWVFITHWAILCWGIFLYSALAWWTHRIALSESMRLAAILAGGALAVAPYIYFLVHQFPETVNFEASPFAEDPLYSLWGESPPRGYSLFFLVTFDLGANFYLAIYGLWAAWRSRAKFAWIWASVVVGSYFAWIVSVALLFSGRARQSDDIYYFLVFAVAVQAGLGAHHLVERASGVIAKHGNALLKPFEEPRKLAAAVLLLWLPLTLGWWWNPMRMDAHFRLGLTPMPRPVAELGQWVREQTQPSDVFLAEAEAAIWIPAISGRRIVFADDEKVVRDALERRVLVYAVVEPDATLSDQPNALLALLKENGEIRKVFELGSMDVYTISYESRLR